MGMLEVEVLPQMCRDPAMEVDTTSNQLSILAEAQALLPRTIDPHSPVIILPRLYFFDFIQHGFLFESTRYTTCDVFLT